MKVIKKTAALLFAILMPATALAFPPPILCGNIPGCGQRPANIIYTTGIPLISQTFLNVAAALSLLFVVIGGARLLISLGNEEGFNKAKQTVMWALAGLITAISAQKIVLAVISQTYVTSGNPLLDFIATMVNIITMLLNISFLIAVLIGGFRMVMARGKDDEIEKGRTMVIYAILGAVVINVAPFVVKQVINW